MNDANTNQAILFADIIDSMRLYESLGDEQAHTIACGCIGAIQQITLDHGGRVVKTMGDGIMCVFPSADKAFVASALMHDNPGCARVTVRVGFHVGPAIEDEGDVFGDAVNLAARVAAMAKGGETLLTGESVRLLSSMYVANTRLLDTTTLKGKSETVDIFSVVSGREDETTMRGVNVRAAKPVQSEPSLIITFGDREISISRPEERILVGRDEECDIVVDARYASRRHAMFMAQRHRFLLIDQSTNGTFLKGEDGQLVVLKREFQQLVGSGEVSFGEKPEAEPEMVIRYRIET